MYFPQLEEFDGASFGDTSADYVSPARPRSVAEIIAFDQTILARLSYAAEIQREGHRIFAREDGSSRISSTFFGVLQNLSTSASRRTPFPWTNCRLAHTSNCDVFVVEFITQAVRSVVDRFSLALNFDARFGNISAGYHPHTREHSISRVRICPEFLRGTCGDIELLMQREKVDEWAGELELLNDNIIAADNALAMRWRSLPTTCGRGVPQSSHTVFGVRLL
ncbi:hypothetical protein B0H15DRAFT_943069 [Mycena belliarum]|uniref:Uncharacterized protein n=1 Tax=Mycena belliarum TaxID=1033014 RepID=A0AAD6UPW0_9AGAR|nr:hypothetical protein B0H15DRAFT_943069 [Mycena belliae]